eukprot:762734-Hanusia_phi.AAC.9
MAEDDIVVELRALARVERRRKGDGKEAMRGRKKKNQSRPENSSLGPTTRPDGCETLRIEKTRTSIPWQHHPEQTGQCGMVSGPLLTDAVNPPESTAGLVRLREGHAGPPFRRAAPGHIRSSGQL